MKSIRGRTNRKVLDRIAESTRILEAWGDEPWVNEGAAVRVSLVCFGERKGGLLNGRTVGTIYADLTAAHVNGAALSAANLTLAKALPETAGAAYLGIQKTGPFDVPGSVARRWLALSNPHGRPNSEVVKPWFNGLDVTRRNRDFWIVDFGVSMEHDNAELFEAPFAYAREHIQPTRQSNTDASTSGQRWLFHRPRPAMREATRSLKRFIVPPEVSKHRVFAWIVHPIVPYKNLTAIAREDDRTFGVLHSRFHELWALRLGTSLEDRPRYTPTTTFETFPFPAGMTPADTRNKSR